MAKTTRPWNHSRRSEVQNVTHGNPIGKAHQLKIIFFHRQALLVKGWAVSGQIVIHRYPKTPWMHFSGVTCANKKEVPPTYSCKVRLAGSLIQRPRFILGLGARSGLSMSNPIEDGGDHGLRELIHQR